MPIHCAAQSGSMETVRMLLRAGASSSVPSARILFNLTQGRAPTPVDGVTPLHVACACGHDEVVAVLLAHRAAEEPRKTALGFASAAGEDDIVEQLRRATAERMAQLASEPLRGLRNVLSHQNTDLMGGVPAPLQGRRMEALRDRVRAREGAHNRNSRGTSSAHGGA